MALAGDPAHGDGPESGLVRYLGRVFRKRGHCRARSGAGCEPDRARGDRFRATGGVAAAETGRGTGRIGHGKATGPVRTSDGGFCQKELASDRVLSLDRR